MSLTDIKSAARAKAKELRQKVHRRISNKASYKISSYIEEFMNDREEFKVIAVYMPIQSEIDIRPVVSKMRKLGKTLCLPVVVSNNKPLIFKVWNENSKLFEGKFRVLVPESSKIVEPDLVLCPMLSFDIRGYRLGYGGGFYDRTFYNLAKKKVFYSLGCAYSEQASKTDLPIGKYDKPLDAIATENGLIFFNS